ncbi:MMPL family transporter [Streptomyces sp. P9-A2]|uniref:MMPL family transporter n=1 Tax=Streptomyces sp. P9-A2 TaxID=3072284 RepID=UPI002FC7A656
MSLEHHISARIGYWSAAHPWRAVLVWLVLTLAAFSTGFLGETRTATQADMTVGESARAARLIEDNGLKKPATENFLVSPRAGQDATGAADELKRRLAALPEVASVAGPLESDDGRTLLVRAAMKGDADSAPDRVTALTDVTAEVQERHPGLRVEETGDASIQHEFRDWLAKDMSKATAISVPITLVVLMVVFGALVHRAAAEADATGRGRVASAAKARACALAEDATLAACDLLGPAARANHPELDKLVRDARGAEFMEGTRNIQHLNLFQGLLTNELEGGFR